MQEFVEKYTVEFILASIMGWITTQFVKIKRKNLATQNGVQALLRSSIIAIYNRYTDKGYMPIYEKDNLTHLHDEYKNLGGNGTIDRLYDELMNLPVKEVKTHEII